VENGSDVYVKVVDGTTVLCKGKCIVTFNTTDDDDDPITLVIQNIIYVPGLIRRLFSVDNSPQSKITRITSNAALLQ
jgi:hypothetical protein